MWVPLGAPCPPLREITCWQGRRRGGRRCAWMAAPMSGRGRSTASYRLPGRWWSRWTVDRWPPMVLLLMLLKLPLLNQALVKRQQPTSPLLQEKHPQLKQQRSSLLYHCVHQDSYNLIPNSSHPQASSTIAPTGSPSTINVATPFRLPTTVAAF